MTNLELYKELEKEFKRALWEDNAELADRIEKALDEIPLTDAELAEL